MTRQETKQINAGNNVGKRGTTRNNTRNNAEKNFRVFQRSVPRLSAYFCVFFLFSIFYFLLSSSFVFAATIFFGVQKQQVGIEQQFEVGVFLNTQGQEINAVEGNIQFPANILEIEKIRDGGSILLFWIEKPNIEDAQKKGELFFSGLIPGGYGGQKGYLFSIIFVARQTGPVNITTSNEKILLNDGLGTATQINKAPIILQAVEQPVGEEYVPPYDPDPPEPFEPVITQNSNVFNNQWFLVFATQDKGAGIDHYEIQENRKQKIEDRRWDSAESPYLLKDQKLKSFVYVKAVDKAGHEKIAMVAAARPLKWYEIRWLWSIIILVLLILLIFLKNRWSRLKR